MAHIVKIWDACTVDLDVAHLVHEADGPGRINTSIVVKNMEDPADPVAIQVHATFTKGTKPSAARIKQLNAAMAAVVAHYKAQHPVAVAHHPV